MRNADVGTSAPHPNDHEAAIQRLLFVADAAVADVEDLPPAVRTVIDTASEVYVVTPTLPGDSPGLPTMWTAIVTSQTNGSTPCWATCTRSTPAPTAWLAVAAS
jgi:hypothetical protein